MYGIPITVEDEENCACGAEWAEAKILVKDDDYDAGQGDLNRSLDAGADRRALQADRSGQAASHSCQ
ncbi:hypothetical protein KB559_10875 [Paenibacillus sp. Marseille-P2973]|uniref:hypothetical protein n=1 Tax=Paenibacillus sp. Marseille-P2973 TaxID=1871032 RepID=UPI001B37FB2C|nr:hypothetical protein [Paenibacillus sp. Marseille-P2973]MBQ4899340.1 hypothetical protein [Paenibacillus sp. Marseille-P2973]